ncbi:MAG: hypothetical protein D6705_06815 [Deltaproteobacteria bacterium]|nr:MAG: hypothetical protein D6705_06815 [Deltaproteobacteria bacterium]
MRLARAAPRATTAAAMEAAAPAVARGGDRVPRATRARTGARPLGGSDGAIGRADAGADPFHTCGPAIRSAPGTEAARPSRTAASARRSMSVSVVGP